MAPSAVLFILMWLPAARASDSPGLLTRREADSIRKAAAANDARFAPAARALRREAERRMNAGPWSVTFRRPAGLAIGRHDFFSEGPYWWPDPKNPKGPYIRRDGEVNPDRFEDNDRDMGRMSDAVFSLGAAAFLFDEPRFAERAALIARVWFIDPETRMNPHLEYGQAVRGRNTGRSAGIIDSRTLVWAAEGLRFLDATGRWKAEDREAARRWFAQYLKWLTTSEKGVREMRSGNNHATWWAVQAASFAGFTGDAAAEQKVWAWYREELVPRQIRPDGSCPREEARTKSLSYSAFNLDAFTLLCRLAEKRGVDLWRYRAPGGASVAKAVEYLAPYVENPAAWPKQQISRFQQDETYFLALAGMGLGEPRYLAQYRRLARPDTAWQWLIELMAAGSTRGVQ